MKQKLNRIRNLLALLEYDVKQADVRAKDTLDGLAKLQVIRDEVHGFTNWLHKVRAE